MSDSAVGREKDELIGVPRRAVARIVQARVSHLQTWESERLIQLDDEQFYSLQNIVEAAVLVELGAAGVARRRRIAELVQAHGANDHPMARLLWGHDATGEVYILHDDEVAYGSRRANQGAMRPIVDPAEIRVRMRRRAREREPGTAGQVGRHRGVRSSKPVFEGTRTPVAAVHTYLEDGYDDDAILAAFPHLTMADIEVARSTAVA